jgi:hypothetical protein
METESSNNSQFQGAEISGVVDYLSKSSASAVTEFQKLKLTIAQINVSKAALSTERRAGHIFEAFHAATYNADARVHGDFVTTALTGSGNGFAIDPRVDIKIVRGEQMVAEVQAKCCATSARSAVSVAQERYMGTQRVIPQGQVSEAKAALIKSAAQKINAPTETARAVGNIRAETASQVQDKIHTGGHSSQPLSQGDATRLAQGNMAEIDKIIAIQSAKAAVQSGAAAGALLGGGVSVVRNTADVLSGKVTVTEATVAVVTETALSAGRGAGTALVSEGVKYGATKVLAREAAQVFSKGSGPLAIAGFAMDVVVDGCQGKLTVERTVKSAGRAASAWAGCEGGALLGTAIMPGVGTVVGGILGGLVGSVGFDAIVG